MPGSISFSYDPEWGTGDNRGRIDDALDHVYGKLTGILKGKSPIYILDLVTGFEEEGPDNAPITARLA